jgi:hypothetical protein
MPDKPLQPFAPPTAVFNSLHASGITGAMLAQWLLYIVFAFWALYTLVAIYHWLKYSHGSWAALPAIIVHLVVSLALMAYALSGTLSL